MKRIEIEKLEEAVKKFEILSAYSLDGIAPILREVISIILQNIADIDSRLLDVEQRQAGRTPYDE